MTLWLATLWLALPACGSGTGPIASGSGSGTGPVAGGQSGTDSMDTPPSGVVCVAGTSEEASAAERTPDFDVSAEELSALVEGRRTLVHTSCDGSTLDIEIQSAGSALVMTGIDDRGDACRELLLDVSAHLLSSDGNLDLWGWVLALNARSSVPTLPAGVGQEKVEVLFDLADPERVQVNTWVNGAWTLSYVGMDDEASGCAEQAYSGFAH